MAYAVANQGNRMRYRCSIRRTNGGVRCNSTIICSGVITVPRFEALRARAASRGAKSRKNVRAVPGQGLSGRGLLLSRFKPFALIALLCG